jgi:hypothetical protein
VEDDLKEITAPLGQNAVLMTLSTGSVRMKADSTLILTHKSLVADGRVFV